MPERTAVAASRVGPHARPASVVTIPLVERVAAVGGAA